MKSIDQYWYSDNIVSLLLRPVSWLYCYIVFIRQTLYKYNIKKRYSADKPVIVVGNIAVGGSGKTPLIIALCEYLISRGFKPGIVSRGYGGSSNHVTQVTHETPAAQVGDEPYMIYQKTSSPVVVAADRVAAVDYLLTNNECDVVLSDDGLQHYRMHRAFEICVIDSRRVHGNGCCLPAGPLREPVSRLQSVDMIVYSGVDNGVNCLEKSDLCIYSLEFIEYQNINNNERLSLSAFEGKTVHAVAGIGSPQRFFQQLRDNGLTIIEHPFPDHHQFDTNDFVTFEKECIIMTEKDAVKCKNLSLDNAWFVDVRANFSDALTSQLGNKLLPLLVK